LKRFFGGAQLKKRARSKIEEKTNLVQIPLKLFQIEKTENSEYESSTSLSFSEF
jgi:hypothetical protein